jgi:phosphoglycolate phosphatase-like HAD superfamily hydrolase
VGDGVWDARATRALGIGFLGVRCDGRPEGAERLRREGAERVVHDLTPTGELLQWLSGLARAPAKLR